MKINSEIAIYILCILNVTLIFSQNVTMGNTTKEIALQGKEAIVQRALEIIESNVSSLEFDIKDYEVTVLANKTQLRVVFVRLLQFKPLKADYFKYNITVDLINKKVSPFDDCPTSSFYIPTKEEQEKIKFVRTHAKIPYKGFVSNIVEEEDRYRISITNKYSFSKYYINKTTGEESVRKQGSYISMPKPNKADKHINEDPLQKIYVSTTQEEILDMIAAKMVKNKTINRFIEITNLVSVKDFEAIKKFILKKGNRRMYRNFDSDNPHYHFDDFHAYLNSEIGQKNMNNNPEISDFNEITLHDWNEFELQYYTIKIVRKGDAKNELIDVDVAMKEGCVYLLNRQEKNLDLMLKNLKEYYLVELRDQMN